ncbi:uncharacterized protein LOC119720547 [Patiria miniata]|uniref:Uncharacterized protein n=1 Tax=Patiria miniata TaxID=46514 RepID=A0A913Z5V8_PATMI|nr:uncharacterized protein LOC119720547 [Patiria miniata]
MSQRQSRTMEKSFTKEDRALQKNVFARRHLDADLEAQQGLEKIHLQTIRNEKMRLQKELERMRGRGQRMMGRRPVVGMSNNTARLTQLRLNRDPVINGATSRAVRATSPVPGATGDPNTARVPLEAVGRGRQSIELPAINPGNRSSRNGYRNNRYEMGEDYIREQQLLEHKKIMSKKQEELLARVEKFGEDLGAQKQHRAGSGGEPSNRSPTERSVKSDDAMTSISDPSSSFPPPGRTSFGDAAKRGRSNSLSEYDLTNIKQSITKRLVGEEKVGQGQSSDAGTAQEKQQLGRTVSTTSSLGSLKTRRKNQSTGSEPLPRPMDMVFDQNTYAPDGSLRTIHMLPDPTDSFEEAKKARYLRWRGPQEDDVELSVDEIFGKSDGMVSRKESSVATPSNQGGSLT